MPAEIYGERYQFLPKKKLLTFEEINRLTQIITKLGAVKLRVTGGEPLVRNQIEKLIGMLSKVSGVADLALTTNGYLLKQMAQKLKDSGLQRITVSLDSLDDEIFKMMNGRQFGTQRVIQGIKSAKRAGLHPVKINCVVQRGINDHTIIDLARFAMEDGYIVRFIEYMDVGNLNGWKLNQVVPASEIFQRISEKLPLEPVPIVGNYAGEVAMRYRFSNSDGEIGIIASVTKPFCGDCTRLRLSPEGQIMTCLFASIGTDLRTPMRNGASDKELEDIIEQTWSRRIDRYSEERSTITNQYRKKKVEMYHIGG